MKLIVAIKLRIKLEIDGTVHVLSLKLIERIKLEMKFV